MGRPPKDIEAYKSMMRHTGEDEITRIPIEGVFGTAKRQYGLSLIKMKLQETSETAINMTFLLMNLEKTLKRILFVFFGFKTQAEIFDIFLPEYYQKTA